MRVASDFVFLFILFSTRKCIEFYFFCLSHFKTGTSPTPYKRFLCAKNGFLLIVKSRCSSRVHSSSSNNSSEVESIQPLKLFVLSSIYSFFCSKLMFVGLKYQSSPCHDVATSVKCIASLPTDYLWFTSLSRLFIRQSFDVPSCWVFRIEKEKWKIKSFVPVPFRCGSLFWHK